MLPEESLFQHPYPGIDYAGRFRLSDAFSMYGLLFCLILWPVAGMTQIFGLVLGQAHVLSNRSEIPGSTVVKAGDSNLGVYPNPVANVLSIHLNDASVIDGFSLRDRSGTVIYHEDFKIPVHVAQLNLKARPAGEYILQVRSGDRVFSKNAVKQ